MKYKLGCNHELLVFSYGDKIIQYNTEFLVSSALETTPVALLMGHELYIVEEPESWKQDQ
jgi:hypothetical protein